MIALKNIVGTIAPFIGNLIGGPFAAAALSQLSTFLLGKPDGSEAEIIGAISIASPEKILELKKVDSDFKIKMAELGLDEKKLDFSDRQNARDRELQMTKMTGRRDFIVTFLVIITCCGFFLALFYVLMFGIDGSSKDIAFAMIGVLGAKFTSIYDYFIGSSSGSAEKMKILNESKK